MTSSTCPGPGGTNQRRYMLPVVAAAPARTIAVRPIPWSRSVWMATSPNPNVVTAPTRRRSDSDGEGKCGVPDHPDSTPVEDHLDTFIDNMIAGNTVNDGHDTVTANNACSKTVRIRIAHTRTHTYIYMYMYISFSSFPRTHNPHRSGVMSSRVVYVIVNPTYNGPTGTC